MHAFYFWSVSLVWGVSFLLMKKARLSMGSIDVAAWRVALGAAALWLLWGLIRGRFPGQNPGPVRGRGRGWGRGWRLEGVSRQDLPGLLVIGVIGYVMPFWVQPLVIGRVEASGGHGSALAGMMVSFVPALTILVSIPMLGVHPTRRQVVGVSGGLLCMFVLFAEELRLNVRLIDLGLAALSPLGYAISNTYIKRRFADRPTMALTCAAMSVGSLLLLPLSAGVGELRLNDQAVLAVACVVVLGVLGTGVANYFFYKLIQERGPLYAGMVTYVIPCVSLLLAGLDGERITPTQTLALLGALAMVAVTQGRTAEVAKPKTGVGGEEEDAV